MTKARAIDYYNEIKDILNTFNDIKKSIDAGIKVPQAYSDLIKEYQPVVGAYGEWIKKAEDSVPDEYKFLLDKDFQAQLEQLKSDKEKVALAAKTLKDILSEEMGDDGKADAAISKDLISELASYMEEMGLIGEGAEPKSEGEGDEEGETDGSDEPDTGENGDAEPPETAGKEGAADGEEEEQAVSGEAQSPAPTEETGTTPKMADQPSEPTPGDPVGLYDEQQQQKQPEAPFGSGPQAGGPQAGVDQNQPIVDALSIVLRAVASSLKR